MLRARSNLPMTVEASSSDCLSFPDMRGWSIKRGHARRLLEPKKGKAAICAEIQGQGKEVLRGRSAFRRTIGHKKNRRSHSYCGGEIYSAKRCRVKCRKLAIADSEDVLAQGHCLQSAADEYLSPPDFQMYECGTSARPMSEALLYGADEAVSDLTTSYIDAHADEGKSIDSESEASCNAASSCQSTVPSMVGAQRLPDRTKVVVEYKHPTLWELAVIRAEVSTQLYELFVKEHGRPVPESPGWRSLRKMSDAAGKHARKPNGKPKLSFEQKLLKYCNTRISKGGQCHGTSMPKGQFKASYKPEINAASFEKFREKFLADHGMEFCKGLHSCFRGPIQLEPTPLWRDLKLKFLEAATGGLTGSLVPAFHGTDTKNLSSIYENGFMIPGQGNKVKVAHGSAHGLGIYAATLNNPGISWGFCSGRYSGNESMLVCGVIDDSVRRSQAGFMGHLPIHSDSGNIRRVGDAIVAFDRRRIAPLFVASRFKPPAQTNATNLRVGNFRKHVGPRSSSCHAKSRHADLARRKLVAKVGHSISLRPRTKERRSFQKAS